MSTEYHTILYINRSDSRCSCGIGAFPSENGHYTAAGWDDKPEPCGNEWEAVSSEYVNMAEMMLRNTFGYDNLIGLPVVKFDGSYLGVYGGQTRENATLPAMRDEKDFTVYETDDLR